MGEPVVVQGTAVASPYGGEPAAGSAAATDQPVQSGTFTTGEKQETKCRDPIFAALLYVNVAAIIIVAAVYGPDALESDENNNAGESYDVYVYTVLVTGASSLGFSAIMLWVMMKFPETLIKISLIFVVALSGAWAVISFIAGQYFWGIIGAVFFLIGICYAKAVWPRIPFATANLVTSTTAIKSNCGITMIAYVFGLLAFGWSFLWSIALMGVWDRTYECDEDGNNCTTNYGYLFLLFVAFYFTHQVLQNSVHVSVAGVLGTWWFAPEESSSCCSSAVRDSFCRTMTTSFGSICFGSLLVAIIEALRALASSARANDDGGILVCIAECILSCLAQLVEYFNKWAFIYVGLYGYSYLEAGKNVFTLFKNRGWEAVIADDLVGNTLFLVSVVVGGLSGCVGLILEASSDTFKSAAGNSQLTAFLLGFVVGLALCSILMSTIGSGVNATIVLFAEAPAEFEQNHPELSRQMRDAYMSIYPGSV